MGKHEGEILRKYVRESKITQEKFAETLGMTRQNLNNYFLEPMLPHDFKDRLKENGHLLFAKPNVDKVKPEFAIPYLGELDIFAGKADIANADLSEYITEFISIPGFRDADYFVNVRGHSMWPRYAAGEIIAIKQIKDLTEIQFGQSYVVVTPENRVIKNIRKSTMKGQWRLESCNKEYDSYEIEVNKVKALFLVLGKITKDVL